ncbi:glycoside hydrolase family 78 protein [Psychrosphaera sp. B3R10]|uniref:alpha-L-rhamnosidase n=1 Tax=unclassified Psychrosphaera TaxID=2641570 RepID=UPI001C090FDF|nr:MULTISPECIES: alpha-L-rhamnosidase [unclassified Psychrosphaera]MBU2883525.1 glycoside hydrolase family 78 protein [Psychrosphaera sp. I2R16]MBU2989704.1 glycoside hydrolase family 78 protein [Psychrosphaera sp. B3R10]MDO6719842.1 family 78 glycoside hydrolase catalytic domain [Psychrosphaera sp. 1_MG-2023]
MNNTRYFVNKGWYATRIAILLLVVANVVGCGTKQDLDPAPSNLLVEGNQNPLNVHNPKPSLAWYSNVTTQSAYQIQVATSEHLISEGRPDLWDSGQIQDRRSVHIAYEGKPLTSGIAVYWRVRVWAEGDKPPHKWSDIDSWEMGLVNKDDWQAKWLKMAKPQPTEITPAVTQWMRFAANLENKSLTNSKLKTQQRVLKQLEASATAGLFRHEFTLDSNKSITKARLHSTAGGYYEIYLNGRNVDDRIMDPGQTDFDKRILYNTDDVQSFLNKGENIIAVHLGSGWYDEDIAFSKWTNPDAKSGSKPKRSLSYGQPTFIAQLEVTYDDGTKQVIASDKNWLSHVSPVLKEGVFSGELFDANNAIAGWNKDTNLDLSSWQKVEVLEQWPTKSLEPQLQPAIKAVKEVKPVDILNPEPNVWVLDFGQNFTGIPTVDVKSLGLKKGQAVYFRYAEWVTSKNMISQKSGGGAPLLKQVDGYIASDDETESWTPIFTWHGFRYIEIRGLEHAPALDSITAHLVRSDVEIVGKFTSSDPLLNQIHDMALWGYESNLIALPMDCPIRERAGWTGDAHAAMITGNYNYNMDKFWDKFLGDFQTAAFVAPAVVPGKRTHGDKFDWAAAEIMIAWEHYRHHGDMQLLADQYESMVEYMTAGEAKLESSMLRIGYGDWCDPVVNRGADRVNGRCASERTTPTLTSSALFAHTANLMSKISTLLNKPEGTAHYSKLFRQITTQFNTELFDSTSNSYGSQTADAMAIAFDIAPRDKHAAIAKAINDDVINTWQGHASVGALGQTYLYRALSDFGYADTAFNIFKAKGYPGYAYLLNELNATTLWERKGGFIPGSKQGRHEAEPGRSLNHPFHSGYDGWFYEGLGGIRPMADTVGYQDFELAPLFVSGLDSVDVSYTTGYGEIKSRWQRDGDRIVWDFVIPNNSSALVTLPTLGKLKPVKYSAGQHRLEFQTP